LASKFAIKENDGKKAEIADKGVSVKVEKI